MSNDRVTVVIANRNYGHFIEECVKSAVGEKPSLIVVIDDGSTDDSATRVIGMMSQPSAAVSGEAPYVTGLVDGVRVDLFAASESRGPGAARNWAMRHAWDQTDFFAILDADDRFMPGRISRCLEYMHKYGEVAGAVYGDYYHVRNNVRLLHCKPAYDKRGLGVSNMVHSACVVRKTALEECGLFDEQLPVAEDYELWMKIAQRRVILHVPEPMMLVHVGDWQMSKSQPSELWNRCVFEAQRRHCQTLLS